ncbi:MAG: hypothetical protein KR126chlam4_01537 [Candidatus Anoxychlamydiales bacterium]|nr:hypothetical protein [Candidatus Anoxychlamydiales bacterium]
MAVKNPTNDLSKNSLEKSFYSDNFSQDSLNIQDSDGRKYLIVSVNSSEDLIDFPDELGLDSRAIPKDNLETLSYFKSFALDPNYTRSILYLIKDEAKIIGVITLFCIPYVNFSKNGYIKLEGEKLVFKSLLEILNPETTNSFVIEFGWFQILPEYRNKKLASNIFNDFLYPMISSIQAKNPAKIFLVASAQGIADNETKKNIRSIWHSNKSLLNLDIKQEKLGLIKSTATFTSLITQKFKIAPLPNTFHFSFGPIFISSINLSCL